MGMFFGSPALLGQEAGNFQFAGILQNTKQHLTSNREAGVQVAIVEIGWNRAEPAQGQFSETYFNEVREKLQEYRALGYKIVIDFGFQYPPDWIFDLPHSRYVDQHGNHFKSATIGENIPNAVFNQAIRDHQEAYLRQVFREIDDDFLFVRLGWMKYGEIAFPVHRYEDNANCYWGYDALAQGEVRGLPPGIERCPVPGWRPGQTSPDHRDALVFLAWYHGALQNYHDWQLATARKYTDVPLAMLYPSWGTRPGSVNNAVQHDLDGSTSPEINGEIQRGLDFERFISGIRDTNVIVYCTWLDSNPTFSRDDGLDRTAWSPSHYLAVLSAEHDPSLPVWAENTGGGDLKVLDLCAERIKAYGYAGFFWAFESDLYDGVPPEIGDYGVFLGGLRDERKRPHIRPAND